MYSWNCIVTHRKLNPLGFQFFSILGENYFYDIDIKSRYLNHKKYDFLKFNEYVIFLILTSTDILCTMHMTMGDVRIFEDV